MITNSAWTLNTKIWEKLTLGNTIEDNLCKRYVSVQNFEIAHGYSHDTTKGKPYSAYEFAQSLAIDSNVPIVIFANAIATGEDLECSYSPEELEELVVEVHQEVPAVQ